MIYTVTEESGTKGLEQLAGSSSTGTPLGTWASFENDYAPNGEWLESGTTFNPNTYPALAMYLGGNTIPERFDHSRPSAIEDITNTISNATSEATAYVCPYDGIIKAYTRDYLYIASTGQTDYFDVSTSSSRGQSGSLLVKKGDKLWLIHYSGTKRIDAQWFKHPLFIKATPTSSDSDYEGTLNAIREFYVRNNTYSTEERLTGGVWIDGKPIYRKTFYSPANNFANTTHYEIPYIDKIINYSSLMRDGLGQALMIINWTITNKGLSTAYLTSTDSFGAGTSITFEYTKITD